MANPPPPRKRSWRSGAGSTPATSAKKGWKPWQEEGSSPLTPQSWWTRKTKLGLVVSLLLGVVLVIGWVVLWLRPAAPTRLILIGAGYETNLAVPPNVWGEHGLTDLKDWAEKQNSEAGQRIEIKRETLGGEGDTIKAALKADSLFARKPPTVILFLAAHGGATTAGGNLDPYLVPNDADLRNRGPLVRLDAFLDALAELPKETKKILLVDASQVSDHWPLGELHNDFARALEERAPKIEGIANLVVIASCRKDERSWAAPEWRQTIFAHFVLEGLKGAADQDKKSGNNNGRVDALELYQYVSREVEHWVRNNRAAQQRPLLLGGEDRARSLELIPVAGKYQPAAVPALEAKDPFASLLAAWEECQKLEKTVPHPATYTPQLWRKYLDTLLRFEQLVRAGEPDTAAKLRTDLTNLHDEILRQRSIEKESLRLTLAMPAALGLTLTAEEEKSIQGFEALWARKASGEECRATLLALQKAAPDRWHKQLLRVRATGLLLRHVGDDPEQYLAYGRSVLTALDGELDPRRPAEAHFVVMLKPDAELDKPARVAPLIDKKEWALLKQALQVRQQAEEAAVGRGSDKETAKEPLPAYSEQVLPWIRAKVEQADAKRRQGEDRLFASKEGAWREAQTRFKDAVTLYKEAQDTALEVRRALALRDRVLATLPYYTHWRARQPLSKTDEGALTSLWQRVHELRAGLDQPDPVRSPSLAKLAEEIGKSLTEIEKQLGQIAGLKNNSVQSRWHEIENLLSVPFLDPAVRLELVQASRQISHDLNENTAAAGEAPVDFTPEENAKRFREAAERQGRIALAVLGNDWADRGDVENKILRPDESGWWRSLVPAGEKIGTALNDMPEKAQALDESASKVDLKKAAADLQNATRLVRQVEGAVVGGRLTADPVRAQRQLLLHELLCWQAKRTYLDYWAGDSPDPEKFYYRLAGQVFLVDARDLVVDKNADLKREERERRLVRVQEEQTRLDSKDRVLALVANDRVAQHFKPGVLMPITDEESRSLYYRLSGPRDVEGDPVLWIERDRRLLAPPEESERRLGRFEEIYNTELKPDPKDASAGEARFAMMGLFRGHLSEVVARVQLSPEPGFKVYQPQLPTTGRIAVQTDPKLLQQYGADKTSLAIVFDCSGSMKTVRPGDPRTRFKKATQALRAVLTKLPPGITVSLRAFGAEEFANEDGQYGGIRLLWPRAKWDADQIDTFMKKVEDLHPKYATPLVRSIAMARQDLADKPARTIVVLTDGADSNFYGGNTDADLKVKGRTITEFLKNEFRETNPNKEPIQVNVIGFEVDESEFSPPEAKAQPEFVRAIKEIGGLYYLVDKTDQLASALESSLLSMRFWIDADAGADPPADLPREGASLSRSDLDQNPRWIKGLSESPYLVRVRTNRTIEQRVRVHAGDSLILDLVPGAGGLRFRRRLYADSHYINNNHSFVRKQKQGPWTLAVLQNQPKRGHLELMTTLEKDEGFVDRRDTVQQVRPTMAWFQVVPADGMAALPPRLKLTTLSDYPAPAWGLELASWPKKAVPVVSAWWVEKDIPPAYSLSKDVDFKKSPLEILNKDVSAWRIDNETQARITIESVKHERRRVEVRPNEPKNDVDCLVVRLSYPAGEDEFFVQLPDRTLGQEHRFFREAGKYTGIFWSVTPEQIDLLRAIHVMSAAEFKKKALSIPKLDLGAAPEDRFDRPMPPPAN